MLSIKLNTQGLIICLTTLLFFGCTHSNKLTIAFTNVTSLKKGSEVYAGEIPIGKVADFRPNNTLDTIYVDLKMNKKVKVPKGSRFYLERRCNPSPLRFDRFFNSLLFFTMTDSR